MLNCKFTALKSDRLGVVRPLLAKPQKSCNGIRTPEQLNVEAVLRLQSWLNRQSMVK